MCVKGLETGDVVVTYRSVLSKSFLESASWKGVLEQTWAETETGCLLSSDFNEAIFCTEGRLISGENHQGFHFIT